MSKLKFINILEHSQILHVGDKAWNEKIQEKEREAQTVYVYHATNFLWEGKSKIEWLFKNIQLVWVY